MDRRSATRIVARSVCEAAAKHGDPVEVVAKATGLTLSDARSRLDARSEFGIAEIVSVGGLLRVPASSLIPGVK